MHAISKVLSSNDTGETGSHQVGILVPKEADVLSFFPTLNRDRKNPRVLLSFHDDEGGHWEFAFVYYNNAFFGGTRNEYRLTRMTVFIRRNDLKAGDELLLSVLDDGTRHITYRRSRGQAIAQANVLKLGSGWKVISR